MKQTLDRIADKVLIGDGCWIWTGSLSSYGYAIICGPNGKKLQAHRVLYEMLVGPIPEGLVIDHLCRVRNCVKPSHLEPVTNTENIRRGEVGLTKSERTTCPLGHPYAGENLYVDPRGARRCRTCKSINRKK